MKKRGIHIFYHVTKQDGGIGGRKKKSGKSIIKRKSGKKNPKARRRITSKTQIATKSRMRKLKEKEKRKENFHSLVEAIPDEILMLIFEFVPIRILFLRVKFVCREWYGVIHKNGTLFRFLYRRAYPRGIASSGDEMHEKLVFKYLKPLKRKRAKRKMYFLCRVIITKFWECRRNPPTMSVYGIMKKQRRFSKRKFEHVKFPYDPRMELLVTRLKLPIKSYSPKVDVVCLYHECYVLPTSPMSVIKIEKMKFCDPTKCPHIEIRCKNLPSETPYFSPSEIYCSCCDVLMSRGGFCHSDSCDCSRHSTNFVRAKGSKRMRN